MNNNTAIQESSVCVNCGSTKFQLLFHANDFDTGKENFDLERCCNCGLARTSPVLTDAQLNKYYQLDYYGSGTKKFSSFIEKWTIYTNNKLACSILSSYKNSSENKDDAIRVLDIGCGRGNLLKAFARQGSECHGVERADFPDSQNSGIRVHKERLSSKTFENNNFDIIVIWHVLEHLTNPVETLQIASKLLRAGGLLVVAVPNYESFQSRLFRSNWFHLDLPRHVYHFDRKSLANLMEQNGLTMGTVSTRSIDQSVYGFIQSALNSLHIFRANSLYKQLKSSSTRNASFYLQLLISFPLIPIALIDYLISILFWRGSCIIVKLSK